MQIPDNKALSTKETASLLGLSASYLERARCYGKGPVYFKIGARVVYRLTDIEAWLASQRKVPGGVSHD